MSFPLTRFSVKLFNQNMSQRTTAQWAFLFCSTSRLKETVSEGFWRWTEIFWRRGFLQAVKLSKFLDHAMQCSSA
jgi:hypothetical protein